VNEIVYAGKHLITYSVTRHAHSTWEFIYCTTGGGQLSYEGGELPYQAGDLVMIPPQVYHRNESESGFTNIHINMREPTLTLKKPTVVHDDSNHFLLDAMSAIFYQFSLAPGKQTVLLAAYAFVLLSLVEACLDAPRRNPIAEEIAAYIVRNYPDESLELDQYLRAMPFNYDYLRKLFKSEIGVTPHQFLSDTRLRAAAERLERSDQGGANISEISHLCGFREPLYFSKVFRKKYGMSPTQYQEHMQTAKPETPDSASIKILP